MKLSKVICTKPIKTYDAGRDYRARFGGIGLGNQQGVLLYKPAIKDSKWRLHDRIPFVVFAEHFDTQPITKAV
jgi:hypothetical protein